MTSEQFAKKISFLISAYEVYEAENMFVEWEDESHQEYLKKMLIELIELNHSFEDAKIFEEENTLISRTPLLKNEEARAFLEKSKIPQISEEKKEKYKEDIKTILRELEKNND